MSDAPSLILASASTVRAGLLKEAGIDARIVPAHVDEDSVRTSLTAEKAPPHDIADALAELKAVRVSQREPQAYVIGCDQLLWVEGTLFSKPPSLEAARDQLRALRGKTHSLFTAICLAKAGSVLWRQITRPKLTMRDFSDDFLESYLETAGEAVLASVGCYQLEGPGSQLFSRVEGDYFSILGLPLLPLQEALRQHKVLMS
jgi:septum formation protein